MSKQKTKTLFEILEEQKLGQSNKKVIVVSKKGIYSPSKTIMYMKALNIAYDYMDFDTAKRYIETLDYKGLEEIVNRTWQNRKHMV